MRDEEEKADVAERILLVRRRQAARVGTDEGRGVASSASRNIAGGDGAGNAQRKPSLLASGETAATAAPPAYESGVDASCATTSTGTGGRDGGGASEGRGPTGHPAAQQRRTGEVPKPCRDEAPSVKTFFRRFPRKILLISLLWFVINFVSWGSLFSAKNLPGTVFQNFVVMGLGKFCAYGSMGVLMNAFPRKKLLFFFFMLSGSSYLGFEVVQRQKGGAATGLQERLYFRRWKISCVTPRTRKSHGVVSKGFRNIYGTLKSPC